MKAACEIPARSLPLECWNPIFVNMIDFPQQLCLTDCTGKEEMINIWPSLLGEWQWLIARVHTCMQQHKHPEPSTELCRTRTTFKEKWPHISLQLKTGFKALIQDVHANLGRVLCPLSCSFYFPDNLWNKLFHDSFHSVQILLLDIKQ